MKSHALPRLLLVLLLLVAAAPAAADKPRIVATILPVHSLVAGLAGDTYETELLLPADASPHGYAMRPSEARRLQDADVVVWVGPELETFLERPLRRAGERQIISLADDLDLELLPTRAGGVWERHRHDNHDDHGHDHNHDHNHDHDHGHNQRAGDYDNHLWLSPAIARAVTEQLADELAALDPEHADAIHANRDALLERIGALDAELAAQLEPVRDRAFIVFHDAYQYFEQHYGLNAAGSISLDPSRMPGARRLAELRARAAVGDVVCLFTEPQFRPALAETVAEGTGTRLGVLDPVGAELEPGPDAWFELMRNLGDGFSDCLAAAHQGNAD